MSKSIKSVKSAKKEFTMSREEYIQMLSMRSNEIHTTTKNSKTGMGVLDIAVPTCCCREDAPCKTSGCYCMKGCQQIAVVQAAYLRNLRIYNENHEEFWEQVAFKIKTSGLSLVRYFDAGDIPDYDFFEGMVNTAKKFKNVKFMAFTKKYFIVNEWLSENQKLPSNFNIIYSAWNKDWIVPNPYNLPVAYVDFKDKEKNPDFPENYTTCPNQQDKTVTCTVCRKCWNKKIKTVVFKQH